MQVINVISAEESYTCLLYGILHKSGYTKFTCYINLESISSCSKFAFGA